MPELKQTDSPVAVHPFVAQHVGDAAFYWQHRDQSMNSALLSLSDLLLFDRLLQANLDGAMASKAGWHEAWEALLRWQGPSEVFVCAVLALQSGPEQGARLSCLFGEILRQPAYLLRGLISAVLWLERKQIVPVIAAWVEEDSHCILQVVAWRAIARAPKLATHPDTPKRLVRAMQRDDEPYLRAAACRAAAVLGQPEALTACLQDKFPEVAAEAAIALASIQVRSGGISVNPANILWRSIWQVFQALPNGGQERERGERRLLRWLQHLALLVPYGAADVWRLLETLPPRLGLHFVLHHADPTYLPWVIQQMSDDRCARLAGWVWQSMTQVDLEQAELALQEPSWQATSEAPERETDELDSGLPLPDAQKIAAYPLTLPPAPVLAGRTVDQAQWEQVLRRAPQPLRCSAAHRLAIFEGKPVFNIRARADVQHAVLNNLVSQVSV